MPTLKKLRWQCRRGKLELDWFLSHYLENNYQQADPSEQQTFLRLLALEDMELLPFFMGDKIPKQQDLADLVAKIRDQIQINTSSG